MTASLAVLLTVFHIGYSGSPGITPAPDEGRLAATQGGSNAAPTWLAAADGQLWVCWEQPPHPARDTDSCWERIPLELALTASPAPPEEEADAPSLDDGAASPESDPRSTHSVEGNTAGPGPAFALRAFVLDSRTILISAGTREAWILRRGAVPESANASALVIDPLDLPRLGRPLCSPTGWLPSYRRAKMGWRAAPCSPPVSCPPPEISSAGRRNGRLVGLRLTLQVEMWRGRGWSSPDRGDAWELGPPQRLVRQRDDAGVWLFLRAGFDPGLRRRADQRVAVDPRFRLGIDTVPAVPPGPLASHEMQALTAIVCRTSS